MRILIAGATGLIGGALVAICKSEGIGVNYLRPKFKINQIIRDTTGILRKERSIQKLFMV